RGQEIAVRVVGVQDRRAGGGQLFEQFGFCLRDGILTAEQLEVREPDVRDDAQVGLGHASQLADLAPAPHRHLDHRRLMWFVEAGPERRAASTWAWPSSRSPERAKKRSPRRVVRESMLTPVMWVSGPTSLPPTQAARSEQR